MAQATIDAHREGAEIYNADAVCRQKSIELLQLFNLPSGLLPLEDVEEVGYNPNSGFVWLRQKKARTHSFRKIGRLVSYASEVTAFVEDRRMRRLTGVKSKELLIWISLSEFYLDPKDHSKITFKTPAGLSRTFPASAFELEGDDQKNKEALPAPEVPATAAAAADTK
ncbi:hypothetical protein Taro_031559 [Colocasia esculenta]|uniref:Uncharacterized protein n=1 Tax=Colocasia esculenta TaxID=4460 RepID=A0A843W197_COLES|nr:hypothetical protein [Colocasia esculenta]